MQIRFTKEATILCEGLGNATSIALYGPGYFVFNDRFYTGADLQALVRELYQKNTLAHQIENFNGCYQVIIVDFEKREVQVIQDRWGTYPLFYATIEGEFVLSTDYKKLTHADSRLTIEAMAEMVGFGHVMGDKTLIEGIREVKPHHIHHFSFNDQRKMVFKEKSYWQYHLSFQKADFSQKSKEFSELWTQQMAIICRGMQELKGAALVPLSAGLDSRLLAAEIDRHKMAQYNLTFGSGADNLEIDTAIKVSRKLDTSIGHYILNINQTGYDNLIIDSHPTNRITNGYFAEKDLWFPQKMKNDLSCFMPGHSGDFMAGSHLKSKMKLWKSIDQVIYYMVSFKSTPLCKYLFDTNSMYKEIITESLKKELGNPDDLINAFMRWDLEERQRRYIMRSVIGEEHQNLPLVIMPFFDYKMMDFFADLPFSFLLNTALYRDSVAKYILKETLQLSAIKVNGRELNPTVKGITYEYYIKFCDYFKLGQKNTRVFDAAINWEQMADSLDMPTLLPNEWMDRNFFATSYRLYYVLSEVNKELKMVIAQ